MLGISIIIISIAIICSFILFMSIKNVGATQNGLVKKNFGRSLKGDNPIAFNGEAGYQSEWLSNGIRIKLWPLYSIELHDWAQVPAGEIAFLYSQIGSMPKQGSKTASYHPDMGDFSDIKKFIENGGQKGIQRQILMPGSVFVTNPAAFLIITKNKIFGRPISPEYQELEEQGKLDFSVFGLQESDFDLYNIEAEKDPETGEMIDMVGVVTILDGDTMPSGTVAFRLGNFNDVEEIERCSNEKNTPDANKAFSKSNLPLTISDEASVANGYSSKPNTVIELLLGNKNYEHDSYQNIQAFFDHGGKMGPQHDVILRGQYGFNPFCVKVRKARMLVVKQGQVAVIKANVGLPSEDQSGESFKFGTLVKPGHRGVWNESLRTGKYAINPDCYFYEIVPTQIITLAWVENVSGMHGLDSKLVPIIAKSKEGFEFVLDLQVQIHISDVKAPLVISMVGSIHNLVNEVLQAAVGNYFLEKLQSMSAVDFIEKRGEVQKLAHNYIEDHLKNYHVELKGVYIQNVNLPEDLIAVLKEREIANQRVETYKRETLAETARIEKEFKIGQAERQGDLARSEVEITIERNNAKALEAKGEGQANFTQRVGEVAGAEILAIGTAKAQAMDLQRKAIGPEGALIINALGEIKEIKVPFVPGILVSGNNGPEGGLVALCMKFMNQLTSTQNKNKLGLTDKDAKDVKKASTSSSEKESGTVVSLSDSTEGKISTSTDIKEDQKEK